VNSSAAKKSAIEAHIIGIVKLVFLIRLLSIFQFLLFEFLSQGTGSLLP
jgi:hypothetical protein